MNVSLPKQICGVYLLTRVAAFMGMGLAPAEAEDAGDNSQTESCMLQSILPICSYCKNIRTSDNSWQRIETFLHAKTGVEFTHGICPDCIDKAL